MASKTTMIDQKITVSKSLAPHDGKPVYRELPHAQVNHREIPSCH